MVNILHNQTFLTGKILLNYSLKKKKKTSRGIWNPLYLYNILLSFQEITTNNNIYHFFFDFGQWKTLANWFIFLCPSFHICKWGTGLHFLASMKLWKIKQVDTNIHLYLNRDPNRINPERWELFWTGPRSRKKAWCSTAHFHKCLHALGWSSLKTNVCSCSLPWKKNGC